MNGGPSTGGAPAGGAAPAYQGAGQQAKAFRGKSSSSVKAELVSETGRISARRKKRNQKRAARRAVARRKK